MIDNQSLNFNNKIIIKIKMLGLNKSIYFLQINHIQFKKVMVHMIFQKNLNNNNWNFY